MAQNDPVSQESCERRRYSIRETIDLRVLPLEKSIIDIQSEIGKKLDSSVSSMNDKFSDIQKTTADLKTDIALLIQSSETNAKTMGVIQDALKDHGHKIDSKINFKMFWILSGALIFAFLAIMSYHLSLESEQKKSQQEIKTKVDLILEVFKDSKLSFSFS